MNNESDFRSGLSEAPPDIISPAKLPGVYCRGVQYYDLKNIRFISNTGIAVLIDILKCYVSRGVEVQFVNVSKKILDKIRAMGLEHIFNCVESREIG